MVKELELHQTVDDWSPNSVVPPTDFCASMILNAGTCENEADWVKLVQGAAI